MSKHKKDIEELFSQEFSGFELQPSRQVWNKISYRLAWNSFMRFDPYTFNIYYILLLALTAALVALLITGNKKEISLSDYSPASPEMLPIITDPLISEDYSVYAAPSQVPPDTSSALPTETIRQIVKQVTVPKVTEEPEEQSEKQLKSEPIIYSDSISEIYNSPPLPLASFNVSQKEGCAPMKVQFGNCSENAVHYIWNFGDGGSSAERDPRYVFDEPGIYKITLTAFCANNTMDSYTDSIYVSALPEIGFEMEVPEKAAEGQPVYFYNFTRGAMEYKWNFGDGNISDQKDPSHSYLKAGVYNITLVAIMEEGCIDSAVVNDILKTDEPEIRFPTAFIPNNSGPAGGYYSGHESNQDVFYPYTSELPVEYRLRIFSRKGNLIFESNDINMGWDGYYRQELKPPGVYVWKVRVCFADGRTLVRAGDVTLFWRP